MRFSKLWHFLESSLFSLAGEHGSLPLFNPYSDEAPALDLPSACQIRRENLRNYFLSFSRPPPVLVLGESPGWRGCHFSGVPFTSEAQLVSHVLPFHGRRSSASQKPLREASATIFWQAMLRYFPHFLAWNCLPLHPYQVGNPASNRRPATREVRHFVPFLQKFIEIIAPQAILAVGKDAAYALRGLGMEYTPVRHPAHGGARAFTAGIDQFFGKLDIDPL